MKKHCSILGILSVIALCFAPSLAEMPALSKRAMQTEVAFIDSAAALRNLTLKLDAILQSSGLSGAKKSLCVYSIDKQATYYERQSKTALTPASTTKLFSTFTAFDRLGVNGTIPTKIFTDAKDIENGVIRGNIYVVGHGDALLTINDIETLADKLSSLGIIKIEGGIYADGTYFDAITERHIYSGDADVVEPLPPITALGMSRNSVNIIISPGNPPRIQTLPSSDAFQIIRQGTACVKQRAEPKDYQINRKANSNHKVVKKWSTLKQKTVKPQSTRNSTKKIPPKKKKQLNQPKQLLKNKRRGAVLFFPEVQYNQRYGDAMPLPPAPKRRSGKSSASSRVIVRSQLNDSGVQEFVVSGGVGRGSIYSASFVMRNPELVVAGALRNRLISGGIAVNGGIGKRTKPQNAMILTMYERPLTEMCAAINKNSDNFLAEHVFKMIGAQAGGQKNTAKRATEIVKECLEKESIYSEGLCMADGSGLCRKNLISAATEVGLLQRAAILFGDKFSSTLSIAGVDGTLRRRMKSTAAEGNVRAKTGTLRNASALAGYVTTADGERLAFSFIFNGGSVGLYKQTENKLAEALADFSYAAPKPPELLPVINHNNVKKHSKHNP